MRTLLAAGVAVALLVGACSGDGDPDTAADVPGEEVAGGLCRAAAASGDLDAAEEEFARIHSDLHVVARVVQGVDRKAAASLLRAKQDVEQAFARRAAAAEIDSDLRELVRATETGLESLGITVSACDN